jgi:predicted nucleotide-binding protein (sugar kinase/HSP70/actin superfamily)
MQSSTLLGAEALEGLQPKQRTTRCALCDNHCLLTINDFGKGPDGKTRRFITGNRCEKGAGHQGRANAVPNLFAWKYTRLFDGTRDNPYIPLEPAQATRPTIGLVRVLNTYENYPFWFTLFKALGFATILSDKTTKATYEAGIESMPSESVCYPGKLCHGHIMDLLATDERMRAEASADPESRRGLDFIFMPSIRLERQEDPGAQNHYNCPVVVSYPEVINLNVEALAESPVAFLHPFLPYDDKKRLVERLKEEFDQYWTTHPEAKGKAPTAKEWQRAVEAAWAEDLAFKDDVHEAGARVLRWLEEGPAAGQERHGIVLAGRPYHLDPEINHAIPELLCSFGLAVLTEDSVSHLQKPERSLRVVDQWMFHSRLYAAAKFVTTRADLDLIQLNSFGCGLDAITTDQVQEILEAAGKIYTVLKIDEVSNLGAARIRIRSLLAALREQHQAGIKPDPQSTAFPKTQYSEAMKEAGYTIIAPQMAPIHFELLQPIFQGAGYNLQVLPSVDAGAVDAGLKYANNDVCYPSILVTGQIMEAVLSGRYDLDHLAVLITQTGGGCRATNYIALIRKALKAAGQPQIPVISLSFNRPTGPKLEEENPGFKITFDMLRRAIYAIYYGDLLMEVTYRCRPYESEPGSANLLFRKWMDICKEQMQAKVDRHIFKRTVRQIVAEFDQLPLTGDRQKPRVGVVGEILVKFHPTANNQIVDLIESEGCECVVPGLTEFFTFAISGGIWQHRFLSKPLMSAFGGKLGIWALDHVRKPVRQALERSKRFTPPTKIYELADYAEQILSLCNAMGEGWLLTGEMVELIKSGCPNIVCTQPFACLPNHVTGKGVIKELRRRYPESNIVAVDYDPGASEVNQLNRIKLMIAVAKDNFFKLDQAA